MPKQLVLVLVLLVLVLLLPLMDGGGGDDDNDDDGCGRDGLGGHTLKATGLNHLSLLPIDEKICRLAQSHSLLR